MERDELIAKFRALATKWNTTVEKWVKEGLGAFSEDDPGIGSVSEVIGELEEILESAEGDE